MAAAYPANSDLNAYLTGCGFTSTVIAGLDLVTAVSAAKKAFEDETGRKLLAGSASARSFAPPVNRDSVLFLDADGPRGDLCELTSVVYQPEGATAETLTDHTDFWLEPQNADEDGEPWTQVRFRRRWSAPLAPSLHRALVITGRWGYGTTVPDDAWSAILRGAALECFPQLRQRVTGGLLGWKQADVSKDFGVQNWQQLGEEWQRSWDRAVARYRKLRI